MGLLWLTVRTFDGCFDRIPDRPHRISVQTAVTTILAGMVAAGSLVGAIDLWIERFDPEWLNRPPLLGMLVYSLLIALGLVLVVVESATFRATARTTASDEAPGLAAWWYVVGRWSASFCLILLLALGPAILALALASAGTTPEYKAQFSGKVITSYVLANADIPYLGEVWPGQRMMIAAFPMMIAALLVITIFAHGSVAIGVGLAFTIVSDWTRRARAGLPLASPWWWSLFCRSSWSCSVTGVFCSPATGTSSRPHFPCSPCSFPESRSASSRISCRSFSGTLRLLWPPLCFSGGRRGPGDAD